MSNRENDLSFQQFVQFFSNLLLCFWVPFFLFFVGMDLHHFLVELHVDFLLEWICIVF
jgi:hypothetical protein